MSTNTNAPAVLLDLNKSFVLNLEKAGVQKTDIPQMEVRMAIDSSGSMHKLFQAGFVDQVTSLFLGVAMEFDDNASIETGFFNTTFSEAIEATPELCGHYMDAAGVRAGGGTCYAPIIEAFELGRNGVQSEKPGFLGKLFGKKATPVEGTANPAGSAIPGMRAYTAIITDGSCNDRAQFEEMMNRTSGEVFYQFIALGDGAHASYLEELQARYPHVAATTFSDNQLSAGLSSDLMYERVCNPAFIAWLTK